MTWLRWVVAAIGVLMGGWMTFDGSRALIKGDYVTPGDGPYAGQLGPWSRLVRGAGLEPRSTVVKATFVILGLSWLSIAIAHALGARWAWPGLLVLSLLSLWYLPVGTILSVLELVLLFLIRSRAT
jgi:hypothetical protein